MTELKALVTIKKECIIPKPLFSQRRKINGNGSHLTKHEEVAFKEGYETGKNELWFKSRMEAIKWIKELRKRKGELFCLECKGWKCKNGDRCWGIGYPYGAKKHKFHYYENVVKFIIEFFDINNEDLK